MDKVTGFLREGKIQALIKRLTVIAQKPVSKNIILVLFITVFVRGLGFYKESVVAGEFGLSQQLDTFYIAMLIPGFITTVFLGSFKNVFIPNYISEMKTGNNMSSFQTMGFLVVMGISLVFLLFAFLVTDVYIKNFFSGHTEEYYRSIKVQFYFLAPCIILWGLSALITGLLNISNEFKYSSIDTIFIPIVIVIGVFFFKELLGRSVLAVSTLIGSILNFAFLFFIGFKKKIISFGKPDFNNHNAILMFKQVPAKATSGFLTGLTSVTDQFFAAQLAVGSIAAINYGSKIPAFITGLLIFAMSNVLLPYFSKKVMDNKRKAFDDLFKLLKWLFLSCSIVAIVAIFLSDFAVQLFFERKEFTRENTIVVSMLQKITLVYAPFTICGMVLVNFLTSINKNVFMAWLSMGAFVINIILDYILMKLYGVYGISLATTVIYVARSLILFKFTLNQKKSLIGG